MLRGRSAAVAAVCAIVATAAVTAGCGGGGSGNAVSLDPIAAAATKSQHAGAARIRLALAVSSSRLQGKTLRIRAVGAIDGTRSELSFDLGSLIRKIEGSSKGALPAATLAQLAHARMKEIALEQNGHYVVYLRLGSLASQLPGDKQWIMLDVSELGKSAGVDLGKLMSGSQLQPSDLLGMLRGEGAKVRKVGPATIDGTATTHYRVTVDLAKALEAKGLTSPLLGSVAAEMPKLPEDVWIGKDGLVRRIDFSYGFAQAGQRIRMHMTMSISDYGAHVTIAAPPSSQVFDATQFAQQGLGNALLH
jgi:hypothetical protein